MNQILYSGKTRKKPTGVIISIIVAVILVVAICFGFGIINLSNDRILKGVFALDRDLSNMTVEEAFAEISDVYREQLSLNFILKYGEFELPLTTDQIGYGYEDAKDVADRAYAYGRDGSFITNNFKVLRSYLNKREEIGLAKVLDVAKLEEVVSATISGDNHFSKDDNYIVSGEKLIIEKGIEGKKVDYSALSSKIIEAVQNAEIYIEVPVIVSKPKDLTIDEIYEKVAKEPVNASYNASTNELIKEQYGLDFDKEEAKERFEMLGAGESMEIMLSITKPEVKISDLGDKLFENILATHSSNYDESIKNRVTNLEVASNRCNNTILYPGDEFSFNKALGHRTTKNGFKVGNSFAGGKVVQTVGGGICQVSSTLYNAALKAGMTITDRTAHGMYVEYVEPSTDATVVDGAIDFKFRNDRKYPVKIVTTCANGIVTASIYGIREDNEPTIEIEVKIIETIDFETVEQKDYTMPVGTRKTIQKPVKGYESESYKVFYQNGVQISKELISKDKYSPTNEIIAVGAKANKPVEPPVVPVVPEPIPEKPILPPGWDNPESGY